MARYLLLPSTLILLAANLVPLVGVLLWGWDAFVLLMLYWLETAVIAFWTIVRIATMPRDALGDIQFEGSDKPAGAARARGVLHAARRHLHGRAFHVSVGAVLRRLGAEDSRAARVRRPDRHRRPGCGCRCSCCFVVRGGADDVRDASSPRLRRIFRLAPRRRTERAELSPAETVLFGLYVRIFVMQVTIILGAWFALLLGTAGAYVFLIAVKTAIDVAFQVGRRRHPRGLDQGEGRSDASSST